MKLLVLHTWSSYFGWFSPAYDDTLKWLALRCVCLYISTFGALRCTSWYEGQCCISWYNNVLRMTKEDPVYFAKILADRHAEISSLFLMRQIRLSTDRFSICNAKWLVYIELAFLLVFGRINFLSSKYRIFLWVVWQKQPQILESCCNIYYS